MTIQDPDKLQKIGSDTDATGAAQISRRRPIGGGATADGQDEIKAIAENSHVLYTEAARSVCSGLTTYGEATPDSPFFTTTTGSGVSREEIGQLIFSVSNGREPLTVYIDHEDADIEVELMDDSLSVIDSGTTTNSGRTQASISLDAGGDLDLRLAVNIRQNAAGAGKLYSLRVEEDKQTVAAFSASDFKPLDDAAYAAERPLSPFLMDRCARNLEAAYSDRLRRAGTWWPASATTGGGENTRPVLASNTIRAWPLTVWPVGVGVKTVEVRLWCTVADAAVSFGLATYDLYTRRVSEVAVDTSQAISASPTAVTVSVDVSQWQGQDVMLLLLVRSADSATSYTKSISAGTFAIERRMYVNDLNSGFTPSLTWSTTGKRYKLEIIDNPAAPYTPIGRTRPAERMVVHYGAPKAYVSPPYAEADTEAAVPDWAANGAYQVEVTEIGMATLYSMEIRETETIDKPSLAGLFRPWLPITSYGIGGLYSEQRKLWMGRTRVHHALWGYDPGRTSIQKPASHFGPVEPFEDDSGAFKEMGAALVGNYDASLDKDGNTDTRMRLRVRGVLAVAFGTDSVPGRLDRAIEGTTVTAEIKVQVSDWDGSDWDSTNVVTSSAIEATVPVRFLFDTETAYLTYMPISGAQRGWHALRGACNPSDLARRQSGFVPFELTVDDDQSGAAYRMCRIMVHGSDTDDEGNNILGRPGSTFTAMWLVGWSVAVDRIP